MKRYSFQKRVCKLMTKKFYTIDSWGQSHKTILAYIYSHFLANFVKIRKIFNVNMKRSSLQKRVSKFMPKSFVTFSPAPITIKLFMFVIYKCSYLARVFVYRKHFQPCLLFVGKAGVYPSESPFRVERRLV